MMANATMSKRALRVVGIFFLVIAIDDVLPNRAAAYVDPGTTGMLSQILYVLFYGVLGIFFYCLRYIKGFLANLREFLIKYVGRKS